MQPPSKSSFIVGCLISIVMILYAQKPKPLSKVHAWARLHKMNHCCWKIMNLHLCDISNENERGQPVGFNSKGNVKVWQEGCDKMEEKKNTAFCSNLVHDLLQQLSTTPRYKKTITIQNLLHSLLCCYFTTNTIFDWLRNKILIWRQYLGKNHEKLDNFECWFHT